MRQALQLEVGVGWQLRGRKVGGVEKTQVTYQYPDDLGKKGPLSFVYPPYDQSSRNQTEITTACADLKRPMEECNSSLKEVTNSYLNPSRDKGPSISNWENIVKALLNQEAIEE